MSELIAGQNCIEMLRKISTFLTQKSNFVLVCFESDIILKSQQQTDLVKIMKKLIILLGKLISYSPGDVLTDVSIWAGQTMYSAHRLVLALSSSYFRFVVTGTAQEGKFPVIFLKVSAEVPFC